MVMTPERRAFAETRVRNLTKRIEMYQRGIDTGMTEIGYPLSAEALARAKHRVMLDTLSLKRWKGELAHDRT